MAGGKRRVVYGLIPRNLTPPGLRGVAELVPHLKQLGVTTLWLSPIFAHPPGDFGYAMTDYVSIDPEHGTEGDLRRLVSQVHAEGMELLLDFAPNHTSDQHPFFQDVRANGVASRYRDYYVHDAAGNAEFYFEWSNLPNLNYDNPAVVQMVVESMKYWVECCDIDGYRMDAAWGIRQRTPDFWPRCVAELRRTKKDLYLLAEASALDDYYIEAGFDTAYDWTGELGQWAWTGAFDDPQRTAEVLRAALSRTPNGTVFRFLNNNDTAERFVTRYGRDTYRLALALLMTLPGVPCVYSGDEAGAEFSPYLSTGPLSWAPDPDLFDLHRQWIGLRQRLADDAELSLVDVAHSGCLAYTLRSKKAPQRLCVVNFTDACLATLRLEPAVTGRFKSLCGGPSVPVEDGRLSVPMAEKDFALLELE